MTDEELPEIKALIWRIQAGQPQPQWLEAAIVGLRGISDM